MLHRIHTTLSSCVCKLHALEPSIFSAELEQDAENRAGDASVPPAHPDPLSADVELFKEESLLRARPKDTGGIGMLPILCICSHFELLSK